MKGYSILSLMKFVVGLAIAITAIRSTDDHWAAGVLIGTFLLMSTAVMGVVYGRGQSRAGWLGFLLFGGFYLGVSICASDDMSSKLPTARFLSYAHARVRSAEGLRSKLVFQIVDPATGVMSYDEAGIRSDASQAWKVMFPGAANFSAFKTIGHCLVAVLLGLVGAIIAQRFERQGRAAAV